MIKYVWTDGSNKDFEMFHKITEEYYNSIVGGLENRTGYVKHNKSIDIDDVLIAYYNESAVGCAGIKRYSDNDAEIKRVWVQPEYRGRHIATTLMELIELKIKQQGYKRVILQTREIMKDAVGLYEKLEYTRIECYKPYDKLEGAICFEKIV